MKGGDFMLGTWGLGICMQIQVHMVLCSLMVSTADCALRNLIKACRENTWLLGSATDTERYALLVGRRAYNQY